MTARSGTENRQRSALIGVRALPAERDELAAAAAVRGQSVPEYLVAAGLADARRVERRWERAPAASWTLELPGYRRPPLSLNDRLNKWDEARVIADVRADACRLAQAAKIGRHARVRVELHWQPSARTGWVDDENPTPTLKALCDGLVDAHVVPDDDRWRMSKLMPVIHDKGGDGRMWLVIEVLPELVDAPPPRKQPAKTPHQPRRKRAAGQSSARKAAPRVANLDDIPEPKQRPVRMVTGDWSARVAARAARTRRERGSG